MAANEREFLDRVFAQKKTKGTKKKFFMITQRSQRRRRGRGGVGEIYELGGGLPGLKTENRKLKILCFWRLLLGGGQEVFEVGEVGGGGEFRIRIWVFQDSDGVF